MKIMIKPVNHDDPFIPSYLAELSGSVCELLMKIRVDTRHLYLVEYPAGARPTDMHDVIVYRSDRYSEKMHRDSQYCWIEEHECDLVPENNKSALSLLNKEEY